MDPNYSVNSSSTRKSTGASETPKQRRQRLLEQACVQSPSLPYDIQHDMAKKLEKKEDEVSMITSYLESAHDLFFERNAGKDAVCHAFECLVLLGNVRMDPNTLADAKIRSSYRFSLQAKPLPDGQLFPTKSSNSLPSKLVPALQPKPLPGLHPEPLPNAQISPLAQLPLNFAKPPSQERPIRYYHIACFEFVDVDIAQQVKTRNTSFHSAILDWVAHKGWAYDVAAYSRFHEALQKYQSNVHHKAICDAVGICGRGNEPQIEGNMTERRLSDVLLEIIDADQLKGVNRFADVDEKKIEVLEIRGDVLNGMTEESRVSRKPSAAGSTVSL